MIYIIYHDYSAGLRISGQDRVAEVRMYGPFDDTSALDADRNARRKATIWAQHNLLSDDNHNWSLVDLTANIL